MKHVYYVEVEKAINETIRIIAPDYNEARHLAWQKLYEHEVEFNENRISNDVRYDVIHSEEVTPDVDQVNAVKNWAEDMVCSMAFEDEDFIFSATEKDIRETFEEWEKEKMDIPELADWKDVWDEILAYRRHSDEENAAKSPNAVDMTEIVNTAKKMLEKLGYTVKKIEKCQK